MLTRGQESLARGTRPQTIAPALPAWLIRGIRLLPLLAAIAGATSGTARAHGAHADRLEAAERRIAREPSSPAGYLQRANLHRRDGHLSDAWADLAEAAARDPGLPGIGLLRGVLLLEGGDAPAAIAVLDSLARRHPRMPEARVRLATALEAADRRGEAAAELERALAAMASPTPDLYLALSRMLTAARPPQPERALRALATGIERLGPTPALVEPAIELELARGNPAAALVWHERLGGYLQSDPAWLSRRGRLLDAAGRRFEALASYTAALEAIESMSPERRVAPATRELEAGIRSSLGGPAGVRTEGRP